MVFEANNSKLWGIDNSEQNIALITLIAFKFSGKKFLDYIPYKIVLKLNHAIPKLPKIADRSAIISAIDQYTIASAHLNLSKIEFSLKFLNKLKLSLSENDFFSIIDHFSMDISPVDPPYGSEPRLNLRKSLEKYILDIDKVRSLTQEVPVLAHALDEIIELSSSDPPYFAKFLSEWCSEPKETPELTSIIHEYVRIAMIFHFSDLDSAEILIRLMDKKQIIGVFTILSDYPRILNNHEIQIIIDVLSGVIAIKQPPKEILELYDTSRAFFTLNRIPNQYLSDLKASGESQNNDILPTTESIHTSNLKNTLLYYIIHQPSLLLDQVK